MAVNRENLLFRGKYGRARRKRWAARVAERSGSATVFKSESLGGAF